MTKTKIVALALFPVILLLGYLLFDGIKSKIDEAKEIAESEQKVIEKLKIIREAQKAYFAQKYVYANNWDSLFAFINTGTIYTVEKREIITPRDPKDKRYYLGDSVRVILDTISAQPAKEVLFPKDKYPNVVVEDLKYVPDPDGVISKLYAEKLKKNNLTKPEFSLFAGELEKNKVLVAVVEVSDPYPLDKRRSENAVIEKNKFLRFGSKEEVTTSGNWE
jgi:hypothetical protein